MCRLSSVIPIITTPLSAASGPCCYDICKLQSLRLHPRLHLPPNHRLRLRLRLHSTLRCSPRPPPARSGPQRRLRARLLSAPLPRRPAVTAAASSTAAAPPRPAFPMAITPALPLPGAPPPSHSAGRAAVRTAGPVTHGRAASARAQEPELEHGRRPPTPRDLSRVPPRTAGSAGGRGRGRGRRGPRTHQANGGRSPCHCCGEPLARSPGRSTSRAHNLEEPARSLAVLTRPRDQPPRTQQQDLAQPAFAVRLRTGAGPRACARPFAAPIQRLPGDVVFQPSFVGTSIR
ncbi:uncharacterized protein LOC141572767 [Rhinolophus sinicus]|uniref:uncharacterized protein LOC141572767 n=1 Tax=Rhinolophus sinicus TaxID=89399 RepID=UPI003D798A65